MTMTPEEKFAMAREIAGEVARNPTCFQDGKLDELPEVQSALLAIDRMQERVRAETDWQDISTAPIASHVMAARFSEDAGEWVVAIVKSPPIHPFTHWRLLPALPAAIRETPHAEG